MSSQEEAANETVQTGQDRQKRNGSAYVELAKETDGSGRWLWAVWSANGRIIAVSANNYASLNDAKQAIRNLKEMLAGPIRLFALTEELASEPGAKRPGRPRKRSRSLQQIEQEPDPSPAPPEAQ